jgi:hypothetical protein
MEIVFEKPENNLFTEEEYESFKNSRNSAGNGDVGDCVVMRDWRSLPAVSAGTTGRHGGAC